MGLVPPNPHDALFKSTFSDPRHAEGALRTALPKGLAARFDWTTLEAVPGSFVDSELKSRHTDLLFRVSLSGREARLYLLYEHQSTPHPLMPFRLVAYAVEEASASDEEASAQPRAEEPGAGSKPWSTGDKPAGRAPSKGGFSPW